MRCSLDAHIAAACPAPRCMPQTIWGCSESMSTACSACRLHACLLQTCHSRLESRVRQFVCQTACFSRNRLGSIAIVDCRSNVQ